MTITTDDYEITFEKLDHKTIIVNESLINQDFLESICYEYDKYNKKIFDEFIAKIDDKTSCCIFETEYKPDFDIQNYHFENNIFLPKYHFKKHFTKDVCMWLISESENYAKTRPWKNIYKTVNPTNCLSFTTIYTLYNFLKFSFDENIIPLIKNSFEINNKVNFNIVDLFIVKYENGESDSIDLCKGRCNITVSILLSDILNKSDNSSITYLEQGDMLITETSYTSNKKIDDNDDNDDDDNNNNFDNKMLFPKRYIIYFFINFT